MIKKLLNNPHVFYQTAGSESYELPEVPVSIYADDYGRVVLEQEDRFIVLNISSLKELGQFLSKYKGK